MAQRQLQQEMEDASGLQDRDDTQLSTTPVQPVPVNARAASARPATVKRFSPDRTPLRSRVLNRQAKSAFVGRVSGGQTILEPDSVEDEQPEDTPSHVQIANDALNVSVEVDDDVDVMGNDQDEEQANEEVEAEDEVVSEPESEHEESELPPVSAEQDDEDEDQTFEPQPEPTTRKAQQNKANSRRKRKSDAMEDAEAAAAISSPTAKRAKRWSTENTRSSPRTTNHKAQQGSTSMPPPKKRGRPPLAKKDGNNNTKLSTRQQKEVDEAVEKIKARPGQKKSLYILRRETPADDSVAHTRSGRISIKPLAWWRNEGIVYGGSPAQSNRGVADGARFPLNSIKEIVRKEEVVQAVNKSKNNSKGRKKGKGKGRRKQQEDDSDMDIDGDGDGEIVDPDADDWELDTGTLHGPISIWDAEQQAPLEEEETTQLAHSHHAIETKEVKGSTFRYAKLLSTRFFGTGVVDLPPGGVKKPKNSRKMHMSFFVAMGRVTVEVGPLSGEMTRFSIGRGGFWQVPRGELHASLRRAETQECLGELWAFLLVVKRLTNIVTGNQYSIENEHGKSARIFFSQACEAVPEELEGE